MKNPIESGLNFIRNKIEQPFDPRVRQRFISDKNAIKDIGLTLGISTLFTLLLNGCKMPVIEPVIKPPAIIPKESVPDEVTRLNLIRGIDAQVWAGKKPKDIDANWMEKHGWIEWPNTDDMKPLLIGSLGQANGIEYTYDVILGNNNLKLIILKNGKSDNEPDSSILFDKDLQVSVVYPQQINEKIVPTIASFMEINSHIYFKFIRGDFEEKSNLKTTPIPSSNPSGQHG